ncbi:hypothetical protein NM208_g2669 [Fusarium decemcellulare]|uniref:Uncharacterized protein n=1 Tax=Fusarium decemcellulare TaxID=57161 RepID=A0ACC1SRU3_9HYPO|nr:hypothetical protein NM208_g2669 [Fusarium decemcellulare]
MADLGAYPVGVAKLDLKQALFEGNRKSWVDVLEKFNTALEGVSSEGEETAQQRHQAKDQLLARDRVALLLDHDSPFLELAEFAGFGLDSTPCASLIAGIGKVSGTICMIICHIPSIKGGAWNEYTILKHNRATEIATENRLPVIGLAQAAGAFLPQQFRVFHKAGQMFRDLARRSQNGMPSCSVVFGSSTAGGAYLPGLSDYTIFVRNKAQVFLGGPPLVKMATGEVIGAEELGGADMHATVTGLADQIALDEFDAVRKAREWVYSLQLPSPSMAPAHQPSPPRYSSEDLLSLVNTDIRKPFDMGEVVLRLVDDSRVSIFKPNYGKNLLTCCADIHGSSYGAGNYAMCGRSYQPRFLFTWPSGRCSVMGPDQLAGVMGIVQEGSQARKTKEGIKVDKKVTDTAKSSEKTRDMVERESQAYYTSAHLLDDGIIDPRDTRDVLGICLEVVHVGRVEGAQSHQGLARL